MGGISNYGPVLAALNVMQSKVQSSQKAEAHKSLEEFHKSVSISQSRMFVLTHTGGRLGCNDGNSQRSERGCRSEVVRCNHIERKGMEKKNQLRVAPNNISRSYTTWINFLKHNYQGFVAPCLVCFKPIVMVQSLSELSYVFAWSIWPYKC